MHDMSGRVLFSNGWERVLFDLQSRLGVKAQWVQQLYFVPPWAVLFHSRSVRVSAGTSRLLLRVGRQHELSDMRPRHLQWKGLPSVVYAVLLWHGHRKLRVRFVD